MHYKTFLFDWDGCLAKTLEVWLHSYRHAFSVYEIEIDDKTIATHVFGDWSGAKKQGVEDLEGFNNLLMAEVNNNIKNVDLYSGVKKLLMSLKQENKQIALLSSSLKEFITPALYKHKIEKIFDFILDGNDVKKHKPDPEIIIKAMNRFDSHPETTIMIGDSKSDLGAANAAGIDSMLFYPHSHTLFYDKKVLLTYKPTYVVNDFKSALAIFNE